MLIRPFIEDGRESYCYLASKQADVDALCKKTIKKIVQNILFVHPLWGEHSWIYIYAAEAG